eukprot:scaffold33143_cov45-Phaeocystis_antarctica.AAC.2
MYTRGEGCMINGRKKTRHLACPNVRPQASATPLLPNQLLPKERVEHRHNLMIPLFGPGSPRRQQSHSQAHAWRPHTFLYLACLSTYARKGCSGGSTAS